jgi:hypothetical protein
MEDVLLRVLLGLMTMAFSIQLTGVYGPKLRKLKKV